MPTILETPDAEIKRQIVEYLKRVPFERAIEQAEFRTLIQTDLASGHPLFPADSQTAFDEARALRQAKRAQPTTSAFISNKSVLIVPGFMGSQLRDDGENGLIWIDPKIFIEPSQLSALRLKPFVDGVPDSDATEGVFIREDGAIPAIYAGLRFYLETGRCEVRSAAFDWRKNIEESAERLVNAIQSFANEHPSRPFFLIAHSQGSLVARRAVQLLGKEEARRIVNRLILLGPATYGTFSAALAIAGSHTSIEQLTHFGLHWPEDLNDVLQSMTGLYQMIPWKPGTVQMDPSAMADKDFWKSGVDEKRLDEFFKWAASIDTEFFNDRISILLGDDPKTPSAVAFQGNKLVATQFAQGDGTVLDLCAVVEGVTDVARADGASHMTLPLNRRVMQAVWRVINGNRSVRAVHGSEAVGPAKGGIVPLPPPVDLFALAGVRRPAKITRAAEGEAIPALSKAVAPRAILTGYGEAPPSPSTRRLKVFSFDPLLATDPESMGMESIVLHLDWDEESADGVKLQPGPVGEYLEVVDYDPASRCFYPPVDLNHPNLLAQDGCPLSETDPSFHQQMVYAVGMKTISIFERALGRSVLWSPHLPRDANGLVIPDGGGRPDGEFVRRLRIYPHAIREANAYYDPARKALLFGYFPAKANIGGKVLPRGIVFTCLSYDVVAHEITHALLDGMHRHLLDASNEDVFAFHEAFADIVALFQHFSHPDVLRSQVAKVAGKLESEGMLGQLAQQFGEAIGMHGSLRSYLGKKNEKGEWQPTRPDPTLYQTVKEPHERGAILVAAMFTAFLTIYRNRTRDLLRIATRGSGLLPPGDLHPDLVNRLADEASKAARHLLIMAIRALDYVPPIDLNFGDYLRALVTSDSDLVPGDQRLYRVAIVDAFRQWGIYPSDVKNLSIDSLHWNPPENASLKLDMGYFRELLGIGGGTLKLDRAAIYQHQRRVQLELHEWMRKQFEDNPEIAAEWGLNVSESAPMSIRRDRRTDCKKPSLPKFDVHSVRRCRRIGPDEQERVDILIEVIQRRDGYLDENDQAAADAGQPLAGGPDFTFRGGATLIIDPRAGRIRYAIRKSVCNTARLAANREFEATRGGALGLRANYFRDAGNPFPLLHTGG